MPRPDVPNSFGVRLVDDHVQTANPPRVLTRAQAIAYAAHILHAASEGDRDGLDRFGDHMDAIEQEKREQQKQREEAAIAQARAADAAEDGAPSEATLEQARKLLESKGWTVTK